MKILLVCALFFSTFSLMTGVAQESGKAFPEAVLAAKTVAVLNDTRTQAVTDGAVAELKEWGHFRVVDDPESADVVLHFTKSTERSTSNSQTKNEKDDSTSYGFSVSSSSSIHMEATAKDGFAAFYTTKTDDSKQKAGRECAQAFIGAYQDAVRGK